MISDTDQTLNDKSVPYSNIFVSCLDIPLRSLELKAPSNGKSGSLFFKQKTVTEGTPWAQEPFSGIFSVTAK